MEDITIPLICGCIGLLIIGFFIGGIFVGERGIRLTYDAAYDICHNFTGNKNVIPMKTEMEFWGEGKLLCEIPNKDQINVENNIIIRGASH